MTKAADIIKAAKAEVGYREGRNPNGTWNNHQKYSPAVPSLEWSQNQPWCATFVAWCALKAKMPDLYPVTASCDVAANWFRKAGRWSEYPAIGAQVFFGSAADLVHTGIVYDFDKDYIYTVEGNTNGNGSREGDGVYLKKRPRRSSYTVGYGLPKFSEGIVSADPDLQDSKEPSKPVKAKTRGANFDAAEKALVRAIKANPKNRQRREAAEQALASIRSIPKK